MWEVKVNIFLKEGVLDVQGRAVEQVLHTHGYDGVIRLQVGKCITFLIDTQTKEEAEKVVNEIAATILINPLIETYQYSMQQSSACKEVYR